MTELDMTGWNDKDSKHAHIRKLYEELPFIDAYAAHTDIRVERDGPTGAIGRADEWDTHGVEQLEFLRAHGLHPSTTLLDIGCGAGRLARRAVPFLDPSRYIGIDISPGVLNHAMDLGVREGWAERLPRFLLGDGTLAEVRALGVQPDMIWAHSVLTHLPPEIVRALLEEVAGFQFQAFLFTFKFRPEPFRSGLKQFQYPPSWFQSEAQRVGLAAEELPKVWPAGQRTMRVWRP